MAAFRNPRWRFGLGVLVLVFIAHGHHAQEANAPTWHGDYASALRQSQLDGKPIFAVFH